MKHPIALNRGWETSRNDTTPIQLATEAAGTEIKDLITDLSIVFGLTVEQAERIVLDESIRLTTR